MFFYIYAIKIKIIMKKVLSSLLLTTATVMMFGQTIVSENFESLVLGNLGTSTAGNVAGQNNWYTLNGANTDYQVANIDVAHGKSLTIDSYDSFDTTPNSTLNGRIAARLTSVVASPANNILQVKFDFYTGSSLGAGSVQMRVWGVDGTTSRTLGGFQYNVATKVLSGLGTVNNLVAGTTPVGPATYSWAFSAAPGLVLTPNTWYSLTYEYNKTTGNHTWRYPGGMGSLSSTSTSYSLISGMAAEDIYLYNNASAGNFITNQVGFDNILAQFGNAATLGTNDVKNIAEVSSYISISPNPTSDILNIKTDSTINAVSVVDMTGRKVHVKLNGTQVDVRSLPAGTYLINIETKDGISTEKFIKK